MDTVENICESCVILFHTHSLFFQFRIPSCPLCTQPIVAGDSVHMERIEDGRIMYSHSDCFHSEGLDAAV